MKKFFLFMAAATLMLASCQKDMDVLNNKGDQMNEISLKAASGLTKSAIDGETFPAKYDMLVSAYRNLDATHKGTDIAADFFQGIHFAKGSSDAVWHAATPKY